jgi:hypothetical protein
MSDDEQRELGRILNEIDTFLSEWGSPSRELWSVLTALRGPDADNEALKNETTARLRAAAFPICARKALADHDHTFAHGAKYARALDPRLRPMFKDGLNPYGHRSDHFMGHVARACEVLANLDRFQKPMTGEERNAWVD